MEPTKFMRVKERESSFQQLVCFQYVIVESYSPGDIVSEQIGDNLSKFAVLSALLLYGECITVVARSRYGNERYVRGSNLG